MRNPAASTAAMSVGNPERGRGLQDRGIGEAALAGVERGHPHDPRPDRDVDALPHRVDDAADLLAGDERQRWLEGVGVAAHEDVGHPHGRGLDADPEVAGHRLGLVHVDQLEDIGGLAVAGDVPGPHHGTRSSSSTGGAALPTGT